MSSAEAPERRDPADLGTAESAQDVLIASAATQHQPVSSSEPTAVRPLSAAGTGDNNSVSNIAEDGEHGRAFSRSDTRDSMYPNSEDSRNRGSEVGDDDDPDRERRSLVDNEFVSDGAASHHIPTPSSDPLPSRHDKSGTVPSESLRSLHNQLNEEINDRIDAIPPYISSSRKTKSPARLLQTFQYLSLMEDRVKILEDEITLLKDDKSQDKPAAKTTDKKAEDKKAEGFVRQEIDLDFCELSYEDFQTSELVQKHVLTYLTEETYDWNRTGVIPDQNGRINRVCVNSNAILKWFETALSKDSTPTPTCRIITSPFKPLCLIQQKIRDYLVELQKELAKREAEEALQKIEEPRPEDDSSATDAKTEAESEQTDVKPDEPSGAAADAAAPVVVADVVPIADPAPDAAAAQSSLQVSDQDGTKDEPLARSTSRAAQSDDKVDLSKQSTDAIREGVEHFGVLVDFLDTKLKSELDTHDKLRNGFPTSVPFGYLWHLFYPGQMVCSDEETKQAYIVLNVRGGKPLYGLPPPEDAEEPGDDKKFRSSTNFTSFSIDCVYLDFDGKDFGPVGRSFHIEYYQGEREISLLPIQPLRLLKPVNDKPRADYLIQRGQQFETLARNKWSHREYEGTSLTEKDTYGTSKTREQIDSHVIVDFEHAYLSDTRKPQFCLPTFDVADEREIPQAISGPCDCNETCTATKAVVFHFDDRKMDRVEREKYLETNDKLQLLQHLEDEQRMLLPGYVYGYALRNLDWYRLDVDRVKTVNPTRSTNFEDLVLPDANRTLVKALVHQRRPGSAGFLRKDRLDLVRGKGQGVIILLHGVPGTGKSSTAECIAEHLKCPLFAITCGNIGVTPKEVEENLRDMFYLAHKWNCVMLLDEADVFLQKRDEHDMSRNAVVSVFLRALEYYSGILFLTTNKVGKFDEAFVSRIHMSLYYPMLNEQMTEDIWKVNLRRTREYKSHIDFDDSTLLAFAKWHFRDQANNNGIPWNGRQIRNAFQTAIALAEFEAEEIHEKAKEGKPPGTMDPNPKRANMTFAHFQQVASVSADFNDYLRKTHSGDMFNVADQDQDRYDDRKRQQMNGFKQPRSISHSVSYGNSGFNPNMSMNGLSQPQMHQDMFGNLQPQSSAPQLRHQSSSLTSSGFQPPSPGFNSSQPQQSMNSGFQPATPSHQVMNGQNQSQTNLNNTQPQVAFSPPLNDSQAPQVQSLYGATSGGSGGSQLDMFMNNNMNPNQGQGQGQNQSQSQFQNSNQYQNPGQGQNSSQFQNQNQYMNQGFNPNQMQHFQAQVQ